MSITAADIAKALLTMTPSQRDRLQALVVARESATAPDAVSAVPDHISEAMPSLPDPKPVSAETSKARGTAGTPEFAEVLAANLAARRRQHEQDCGFTRVVIKRLEQLSSEEFMQRERIRDIAAARARSIV